METKYCLIGRPSTALKEVGAGREWCAPKESALYEMRDQHSAAPMSMQSALVAFCVGVRMQPPVLESPSDRSRALDVLVKESVGADDDDACTEEEDFNASQKVDRWLHV